MAKVQFSTGLLENLTKVEQNPGSIYFAIKEEKDNLGQVISSNGAIYFDKDETTRINMSKDAERIIPNAERIYTYANTRWARFITQRDDTQPWACTLRIYTRSDVSNDIMQLLDVNVLGTLEGTVVYGTDNTKTRNNELSGIYQLRGDLHGLSLFTNSDVERKIAVFPVNLQNCYLEKTLILSKTTDENAIKVCDNKLWGTDIGGNDSPVVPVPEEEKTNPNLSVADNIALSSYSLFGLGLESTIQPISVFSNFQKIGITELSSVRLYNTNPMDHKMGIYYNNSNNYIDAGADSGIPLVNSGAAIDFRYSDNCVKINAKECNFYLLPKKPIYLRGRVEDRMFYLEPYDAECCIVGGYYLDNNFYTTIQHFEMVDKKEQYTYKDLETGKLYSYSMTTGFEEIENTDNQPKFSKVWTQNPNETNYVYWMIGYPYYNGYYPNGGYQIDLMSSDKAFIFNGDKLEEYTGFSFGGLTHSLTIGDYVFDGTKDVVVPVYDGYKNN